MSRTLSANLATHIAGRAHTRATMLRLDLVDGTVLAVTNHDQDIAFNLGDGSAIYSASTGVLPSDLSLSTGFGADEIEISGPLREPSEASPPEPNIVTRSAVLGGRFDDAVARFFEVDWTTLADGPIRLMRGYVVNTEAPGGEFKFTVHTEMSKFAQQIGRTITGYCDADFGDARCGYTPDEISVTVTGVTDERVFAVDISGFSPAYADDYWNRGTAIFLTGALAGIRPVEIFDSSAAGNIALWMPLPEPPEIGDTLTLRQGCYDVATNTSKTRPACMAFDNIVNFRGFPDVPGSDQVLRYPNPGGG